MNKTRQRANEIRQIRRATGTDVPTAARIWRVIERRNPVYVGDVPGLTQLQVVVTGQCPDDGGYAGYEVLLYNKKGTKFRVPFDCCGYKMPVPEGGE